MKKYFHLKLIDLYKEKYDPILHEEEHYTSGNREISKQNQNYQKFKTKHLNAGTYIIKVETKEGTVSKKVLIKWVS